MSSHPNRPIRPPSRRHHPENAKAHDGDILTRERVLITALAMIDAEGVEALSMRRLGQALHRDPMRLYRHLENKAALLDAVSELVLTDFTISTADDGHWESALRSAARRFRTIALSHPRMVPLLVTRPLATPLGLRPTATLRSLEGLLELFMEAGFDGKRALHAYRLFTGFLNGHVLNEVQELVSDPEESDATLRLGLHVLPRKDFPRTRSLASVLGNYDGALELEEGLDIILTGLRTELGAQPQQPSK